MLPVIAALLLIGLILIIIEVVLIPGTTVVGIVGFVLAALGVIFSYREYGNQIGFYVLLGTSTLSLVTIILSFRFKAWSRFSLKSTIKSKVNEGMLNNIHVGDDGVAVSSLKPFGKAQIKDRQFEVKTNGLFVNTGVRIKVIDIVANQIIVEPIN